MLNFNDVSMRYADGPNILSNINFELPQGSFHFLTGASGAGKTSLLRLIFLSQRPSTGQIILFNQDVANISRKLLPEFRKRIGFVFQDFLLLDHLTIYENIALPLYVAGRKESEYKKNILELLDWVGLIQSVDSFPAMLSGGEKQRVAIARSIINRPEIILADEPTGNVDALVSEKLMHLFVELHKQGTTILIATHDTNLWKNLSFPRLHLVKGGIMNEAENNYE